VGFSSAKALNIPTKQPAAMNQWEAVYDAITGTRKSVASIKKQFGFCNGQLEELCIAMAANTPEKLRVEFNIADIDGMLERGFDAQRIARHYNVKPIAVNSLFRDRYSCTARQRGMYLRMERNFDDIRQRIADSCSPAVIEKEYGISPCVLNEKFQKEFGMTPKRYGIEERAKTMKQWCRLSSAKDTCSGVSDSGRYRVRFSRCKMLVDEDM
jgi:AraC-like DNA-binding protein